MDVEKEIIALKEVLREFFVYLNKVIGWDTPPDDVKIAELLEKLGGE